jgi:hypothetical protein
MPICFALIPRIARTSSPILMGFLGFIRASL